MCVTRLSRISAANIGPNRFHQNRTVSWQMSIPRSAKRSRRCAATAGIHIHHHDQTDHFWRAVEIPERVAHGLKLPQPKTARKIALTAPDRLHVQP